MSFRPWSMLAVLLVVLSDLATGGTWAVSESSAGGSLPSQIIWSKRPPGQVAKEITNGGPGIVRVRVYTGKGHYDTYLGSGSSAQISDADASSIEISILDTTAGVDSASGTH